MIVRPQQPRDFDPATVVYAKAFSSGDEGPPIEVDIFTALWQGDLIAELSFTALVADAVVGHVTASRATVGPTPVVAIGPIGVLPAHQGHGIGSALVYAVLGAADARAIPLVVLLGSPRYYGRFGFEPAAELGVTPPEPAWGAAFQAKRLRTYSRAVAGPFAYAPGFSV